MANLKAKITMTSQAAMRRMTERGKALIASGLSVSVGRKTAQSDEREATQRAVSRIAGDFLNGRRVRPLTNEEQAHYTKLLAYWQGRGMGTSAKDLEAFRAGYFDRLHGDDRRHKDPYRYNMAYNDGFETRRDWEMSINPEGER